MPLDVRGRTRATLKSAACVCFLLRKEWETMGNLFVLGIGHCNYTLERGIPSKRESSPSVDYVPALCTHRPSLLPIE